MCVCRLLLIEEQPRRTLVMRSMRRGKKQKCRDTDIHSENKRRTVTLHRKQYAFGTKERRKLSHVLKSRENDPFPASGELDDVASDGTSHQVRQPGYTKTGQKGPSKPALYQLVGSKLFKSNSTYGKKLLRIATKRSFQVSPEGGHNPESGCSTDVLMEHIDEDVEECSKMNDVGE